jgi:hypothetical protein
MSCRVTGSLPKAEVGKIRKKMSQDVNEVCPFICMKQVRKAKKSH